jgi:hypothetical protein
MRMVGFFVRGIVGLVGFLLGDKHHPVELGVRVLGCVVALHPRQDALRIPVKRHIASCLG